MRNWNIKPSCLCRKHLIGEHGEIHKAVGNLKHSGKWTKNLTNKGFLEPQNFLKRHNLIAKEMIKRGYNHKSPLEIEGLKLEKGKVDKKNRKLLVCKIRTSRHKRLGIERRRLKIP